MWLINSPIGRKVVMSVSGLALTAFLLFHGGMNLTLVFSEEAYNTICRLLGANWYALVGSMVIGFLVLVHFSFAMLLGHKNAIARGKSKYEVNIRQKGVTWESENMLILGGIVLGFLILHLYNFWFRMQFAEITGGATVGAFDPQDGASYVKALFGAMPDSNHILGLVYCVLYLVWLCAMFLHLNHGVWSALHTLGQTNAKIYKRVRMLGSCVAALAILPFTIVVVYYMCVNISIIFK